MVESEPRALRILLAEDNTLAALLVSRHLARLGHASALAEDGAEALRLLGEQRYDLALMDLQMPVMDGLEVTRRLRAGEAGEVNRNIPVVALTAHALDEYKEQCRAVGMTDFLTKPVELNELDKALARALTRKITGSFKPPKPKPVEDAVLDTAEARRRLGVDKELFTAIVTAALDEFQGKVWDLNEAMDMGDLGEVESLAHTMKSTAASMGANRCSSLCKQLQAVAGKGDSARCRTLLREVEDQFAQVEGMILDGFLDQDE